MNVETATKIILRPYITEKTYALVENESKSAFWLKKKQQNLRLQRLSKRCIMKVYSKLIPQEPFMEKRHLLN